jgi:hypothetical protein
MLKIAVPPELSGTDRTDLYLVLSQHGKFQQAAMRYSIERILMHLAGVCLQVSKVFCSQFFGLNENHQFIAVVPASIELIMRIQSK